MTRKKWFLILALVFLGWSIVIGGLVKLVSDKKAAAAILEKFPDRGVPRINITLNGVSLEEINAGSKDVKYEGNELSLYEGSEVREFGGVQVKGRGNGTWMQEKKPYQIKFGSKVDLFGMGKAKKWVLLANAMDTTHLRNDAAFYLGRMLGMEYAFDGKFLELYIDEEYEGLYYLTHAVEIGKSTINLTDPFGVLVELDNVYGEAEKYYKTRNGELLVVKDIVSIENEDTVMNAFVSDFDELESAIENRDFEVVSSIIDISSFAKYYVLSEFTVNPDAYWTSFYFYKDGLNDKIHAGPGWDFDLAFANRNWGNWMGEGFFSPRQSMVRKGELLPREIYEEMGLMGETDWYEMSLRLSRIMYDMMEMPEFANEVDAVFDLILERSDELTKRICEEEQLIEKAANANGAKWGKAWHQSETEDLLEWVHSRFEYFEEKQKGLI